MESPRAELTIIDDALEPGQGSDLLFDEKVALLREIERQQVVLERKKLEEEAAALGYTLGPKKPIGPGYDLNESMKTAGIPRKARRAYIAAQRKNQSRRALNFR